MTLSSIIQQSFEDNMPNEDTLRFTDIGLLSQNYTNISEEFGVYIESIFGNKFIIEPKLAVTAGDGRNSFGAGPRNSDFGGRARKLKAKGFTFDMGPSWYWMPDVFERHFKINGEKIEDYLKLKRLNPSYKIFFSDKHKKK